MKWVSGSRRKRVLCYRKNNLPAPAQTRSKYSHRKDPYTSALLGTSLQQDHDTQNSNHGRCHSHTGRLFRPATSLESRRGRCHRLRRRPRCCCNRSDCGALRRQSWRCSIARRLRRSNIRGTDHEARASRHARRRCRCHRGIVRGSRCRRCLTGGIQRQGFVILADNRRNILDHETRLRLQKAGRDGLERRRNCSHPSR